ncbi:hypothetical protein JX265_007014 [Neoarthrinium moseri]|uniref:Uncharacterized protein n=1 Tax=Neoarthrinium moseri TaxID=1658444 RepID=A0A9P9WKE5_9PEZI|nr:hypothetical protein JX265_007014 [Neoarthrinium moseri]
MFSARRTVRPARSLCRWEPVQNGIRLTDLANRTSRAPFSTSHRCGVPLPVRKAPPSFAKARFSRMEVPQLAFFEDAAKPSLASGLDPQECFRSAHAYVDLAVADNPGWRDSLRDPPHSLSYATLHYIAVMIMNGPPGPAFNIATHIYHTLTMANYAPSILTVVRLALMRKMLGQPQFSQAQDKFTLMARRKDDPNACTLQGLILSAKTTPETDREALQWFRTAASLAGEEPGAWEWQASCALEMGKIYLRLKQNDRAKAIWRYCAQDLDIAEGCWLYSTLLEPSDPEKYIMVRKAAVSGIPQAAQEMAILDDPSVEGSEGGGSSSWDIKASNVFKKEWQAIAGA